MLIAMAEISIQLYRRISLLFPLTPEYIPVVLPLIAVDYCEYGRDLRSRRVEHERDVMG